MGKLYNLARMTTATTSTGTITLGAAVSGYLTFALAGVANADVVSYGIKDGANSEIGTGTYTSAGTTLTRNVTKSTNANAAISLSGTAEVFITPRAEDLATALPGFIFGLTLSTAGSSATFGIAAGRASDSTALEMMVLASAYTKTTSAWAVGTAAGSLDTGAIANSTWYHAYQIQRPDTGVVDVLTSLSATAPTLPTNYTLFRRIGSMKTNASSQWTSFVQTGDQFRWAAASVNDVNTANPGTAAVTRTLTVPTGIVVEADMTVFIAPSTSGQLYALITSLAETDRAASSADMTIAVGPGTAQTAFPVRGVLTNASSQIRTRFNASGAGDSLLIFTFGWIDRRGRDS